MIWLELRGQCATGTIVGGRSDIVKAIGLYKNDFAIGSLAPVSGERVRERGRATIDSECKQLSWGMPFFKVGFADALRGEPIHQN